MGTVLTTALICIMLSASAASSYAAETPVTCQAGICDHCHDHGEPVQSDSGVGNSKNSERNDGYRGHHGGHHGSRHHRGHC